MSKFFVFLAILALPLAVFAADDVTITSASPDIEDFVFTAPPGSTQQGEVIVKNTTDEKQEVLLYAVANGADKDMPAEGGKLAFATVRFFPDAVPDDYTDAFAANNNNIAGLCKERDASEDLDAWCDGVAIAAVRMAADSAARFFYTVAFSGDVTEKHIAQFIAAQADKEDDAVPGDILGATEITYDPPIKRTTALQLAQLTLTRSAKPMDIGGWVRAGFRDDFGADVRVENVSEHQKDKDIPFTLEIAVQPVRFFAPHTISQEGTLAQGAAAADMHFDQIKVPRFGSVLITGTLHYTDADGQEQTMNTEPARVFMFPTKEVTGIVLILAILIGVFRMMRARRGTAEDAHPDLSDELREELDRPLHAADTMTRPTQDMMDHNNVRDQEEQGTASSSDTMEMSDEDMAGAEVTMPQRAKMSARRNVDMVSTGAQQKTSPHEEAQQIPDIEWMRDDEESFRSAMHLQEKQLNRRVLSFAVVFFVSFAIISFFIFGRDLVQNAGEHQDVGVSIVDLAEQDKIIDDTQDMTQGDDGEGEHATEEGVPEIDRTTVRVQVLNGGDIAGAAGKTTNILADKGYKTNTAGNAQKNREGMMVYYAPDYEDAAKVVLADVADVRTDGTREESKEITDANDATVVVVLGAVQEEAAQVDAAPAETQTEPENITITNKEISVQVLNGGAPVGKAGEISDMLSQKTYTTRTPKNARNDYRGTIIYYAVGKKNAAESVRKVLASTRENIQVEESDSVAQSYGADVVVVIGEDVASLVL